MVHQSIRRRRIAFVLISGALLSACVRLISDYDERTDTLTADLQKATALHFEELRSATMPGCLHENYAPFYKARRADLSALALRAKSIPKNTQTVGQVELLQSSFGTIEKLHIRDSAKSECLTAAEIDPIQSGLDQHFRAIMTLEIAKKRGEE